MVVTGTEEGNVAEGVDFRADIATRKISLLERLVAGVLHELNSPLAVLSTNAALLEHAAADAREGLDGGDGRESLERAVETLESVRASQKSACERISGTLRSLRTCVGLDEAERTIVDVCTVLDSVVQLLSSGTGRAHEVERDYQAPCAVEGSSHQLTQLFMHLLLNGMQAGGADGRVRVSARTEGEHVVVEFADDGDGIAPQDLFDVFDPGFARAAGAAGLGLTICQYIVKQHRGTLRIESEPGNGVTVIVRLPRHGSAADGSES